VTMGWFGGRSQAPASSASVQGPPIANLAQNKLDYKGILNQVRWHASFLFLSFIRCLLFASVVCFPTPTAFFFAFFHSL
jgi:hypothetical protein